MFVFFFSSRRRHTRCALVMEFRRVLFRSPTTVTGRRPRSLRAFNDRRREESLSCSFSKIEWTCRTLRLLWNEWPDRGGASVPYADAYRSEERRVGKECVSKCRSRRPPYNKKTNRIEKEHNKN